MKFAAAVRIFALVVCADCYKHRFRGHLDRADYGKSTCQCIGAPSGSERKRPTIDTSTHDDFPVYKKVTYACDVGTKCGQWDKYDPNTRYGDIACQSSNGTLPKAWCLKRWCYVDPCTCSEVAKKSSYFDGLKDSKDRLVFYSYTTCGADDAYTCSGGDVTKYACPCWNGADGKCTATTLEGATEKTPVPSYCKTVTSGAVSNCLHTDLNTCKA